MSDLAIRVEELGKKYRIGQLKSGDFREAFGNFFSRDQRKQVVVSDNKSPKDFWALKDISFKIPRGEAVGIIGRNGAGKSTLLKLLSRITEPTTGRIEIDGRVASLLEVGTGFHPELTGRENIYLNGTILGMKRKEVKTKFTEIVDFSGVTRFLDTPIKHYSSGMKVRLAFAVAAHLEPDILLIDEVLAVGDAEFQKRCLGKMEDIAKGGRTVIFVSHDLAAIQNLCSTGIVLENGHATRFDNISDTIGYYSESRKFNNNLNNELKIHESLIVRNFQLSSSNIFNHEELEIKFQLCLSKNNVVSDLALLFYNSLNQRIAIVDLRKSGILEYSSDSQDLNISVQVEQFYFIEGVYSIGLYISSQLFTGDVYNIAQFIIKADGESSSYEAKYRGFIDLKFKTNVR